MTKWKPKKKNMVTFIKAFESRWFIIIGGIAGEGKMLIIREF